jgi:hypothetical protein
VTHALTTYFFLCYFYTTTVTNDSFVTDTLVFTAMTFVILYRTEDFFAEKTIAFWLVCAVVDGFRLQNFTM